MDLVVFDLDGTLLNKERSLSRFTMETLDRLQQKGILFTIATGRTRLAALPCLGNQAFPYPQIYKNGVELWDPVSSSYSHHCFLQPGDVHPILASFDEHKLTPFVFCLDRDGSHSVYHGVTDNAPDHSMIHEVSTNDILKRYLLSELPDDAQITNISATGPSTSVEPIARLAQSTTNIAAYFGGGIYHPDVYWLDIHHSDACKGSAVQRLKQQLGATRVICFGDGDNDLSMFSMADEAYAPANATDSIRDLATDVIGHHDEDGVAHFLRQRFDLT